MPAVQGGQTARSQLTLAPDDAVRLAVAGRVVEACSDGLQVDNVRAMSKVMGARADLYRNNHLRRAVPHGRLTRIALCTLRSVVAADPWMSTTTVVPTVSSSM